MKNVKKSRHIETKKFVSIMLSTLLAITCFAACGNQESSSGSGTIAEVTTTDSYPIETDVVLRQWGSLHSAVMASATNFGDTDFAKHLKEATGVTVKYEHPVAGQENAAFNIMINSDDMPDIISKDWTTYPGGPDKAIEEGIIIPLNDCYEKVSPNLMKVLEERPDWKNRLMTDKGYYFNYPLLKEDNKLLTYVSYLIRKDLLDKAGLDLPVTLADWEEVLYTFRDMGIEVPLSVRIDNEMLNVVGPFMGCFGIMGDFYHEDGVVKYGPYEKGFGEYIKHMNKWYNDGILDKEFSDKDSKRRAALVTNGRNGAIEGSVGGDFGNWLSAIKPESGIEYVPVTVPVLNEGDTPMWTQSTWDVMSGASISATSKNKELAARYLDFNYSEEGYLLNNFGKEGVTYTMVEKDGRMIPTYMDWMKDPEQNGGLSFAQCLARNVRSSTAGPFVQSSDYIDQYYANDAQKKALTMWNSDVLKYKMPIVYLTEEEQKTYSDIIAPINTYREETVAKLISGKMPMSELDNYFAQLKKLGIEDAIKIQQTAYDRAMARTK